MPGHQVVFNADDLGFSAAINAGIHAAAEAGLVREASLGVTGPATEEGVRIARGLAGRLGVGLHLNLTEGRALSGPIAGLTDAAGRFPGLGAVLKACWRGRPERAGLLREIRAQVARLKALGVAPTHLNGHHHAHAFPVVREALLDVLRESPFPYVRVPDEPAGAGARFSPRRLLVGGMARALRRRALARGVPLGALPFRGFALDGGPQAGRALLRQARHETARAAEWMVHPVAVDGALTPLADPALVAALREAGVVAACYSELPGAQAGCASTASTPADRS